MITIKQIQDKELKDLTLYSELELPLKEPAGGDKKLFAVLEGRKVLGHATLTLFPAVLAAEITEIYILPQERGQGLGDGLLRTVFNYLRINSFELAAIKYHRDIENFMNSLNIEKVGFGKLNHEIKNLLKCEKEAEYYICRIHEFFERKCKGSVK